MNNVPLQEFLTLPFFFLKAKSASSSPSSISFKASSLLTFGSFCLTQKQKGQLIRANFKQTVTMQIKNNTF